VEIREVQSAEFTIVDIKGRIDSTTAQRLADQLESLVAAGRSRLLIDLDQVDYISSVGFRALLIGGRLAAKADGRLALCRPSARVRELLEVAGFGTLFSIHAERPATAPSSDMP
jgi:anti-sigma B factor antagonist